MRARCQRGAKTIKGGCVHAQPDDYRGVADREHSLLGCARRHIRKSVSRADLKKGVDRLRQFVYMWFIF